MTRSIQQVFDSHQQAFETNNFEQLIGDYADDAVLLTIDGAFVGKEAIAGFFQNAFTQFPNLKINFEQTAVEGDLFLLQWSADSSAMRMPVGVGVLHIKDGFIQRQAEWFQMELK